MIFFKFKMAQNVGNAITHHPVNQFKRNLGGRITSSPQHVRSDEVVMVTAVAYQPRIEHLAVMNV